MKKTIPYLVVFLSLFFASCGSVREMKTETKDMKISAFINSIKGQNLQFVHLSIQSKLNADIAGNSVGLNGKIYIRNGQKIWINLSKFGINAARAEITPNGFKAYERVGKTYVDGEFDYFNELLKVDFIDYDKLQNLLLGRVFFNVTPSEFQLDVSGEDYVLSHVNNDRLERSPKEGRYIQIYMFDAQFRLTQAYIKDSKSGKELEVHYAKWTKVGIQNFPGNVKVLVKDKKTQKVELEYNNFTFEESSTPFSIPSGYKLNTMLK